MDLVIARDSSGRSFLRRQFAGYPYHVGRSLRFSDDPPGMTSLYVQSCAGGIFEHDRLRETITVEAGASAYVATQASTIVHGMKGGMACQETEITIHEGGYLELLPDPLILFPDADLRLRRRLRIHPSATAVLCEAWLMHDPSGSGRPFGRLGGETDIEMPAGKAVALERFSIDGRDMAACHQGITGRYASVGCVLLISGRASPAGILDLLRPLLRSASRVYGGASLLPFGAGVCARFLAEDGAALRATSHALWSTFRQRFTGMRPSVRRK